MDNLNSDDDEMIYTDSEADSNDYFSGDDLTGPEFLNWILDRTLHHLMRQEMREVTEYINDNFVLPEDRNQAPPQIEEIKQGESEPSTSQPIVSTSQTENEIREAM